MDDHVQWFADVLKKLDQFDLCALLCNIAENFQAKAEKTLATVDAGCAPPGYFTTDCEAVRTIHDAAEVLQGASAFFIHALRSRESPRSENEPQPDEASATSHIRKTLFARDIEPDDLLSGVQRLVEVLRAGLELKQLSDLPPMPSIKKELSFAQQCQRAAQELHFVAIDRTMLLSKLAREHHG